MATKIRPGHRWVRRNAVIEIREVRGSWHVFKRYHSVYNAKDEIRAYGQLAQIAGRTPGVRLPTVISVDAVNNEVEREFIPGQTLRERLLAGPEHAQNQFLPLVVSLLAEAHRTGVIFDADPSNFIVSNGGLVMIDPLMVPLPLAHANAATFGFGLLKATLSSAGHPSRAVALHGLVQWTFERYSERIGVPLNEVYNDLESFIGEVIKWNRRAAPMESAGHRLLRVCAVTPLYSMIRLGIRWRAR